jgi:hypothetical protein
MHMCASTNFLGVFVDSILILLFYVMFLNSRLSQPGVKVPIQVLMFSSRLIELHMDSAAAT